MHFTLEILNEFYVSVDVKYSFLLNCIFLSDELNSIKFLFQSRQSCIREYFKKI